MTALVFALLLILLASCTPASDDTNPTTAGKVEADLPPPSRPPLPCGWYATDTAWVYAPGDTCK